MVVLGKGVPTHILILARRALQNTTLTQIAKFYFFAFIYTILGEMGTYLANRWILMGSSYTFHDLQCKNLPMLLLLTRFRTQRSGSQDLLLHAWNIHKAVQLLTQIFVLNMIS